MPAIFRPVTGPRKELLCTFKATTKISAGIFVVRRNDCRPYVESLQFPLD